MDTRGEVALLILHEGKKSCLTSWRIAVTVIAIDLVIPQKLVTVVKSMLPVARIPVAVSGPLTFSDSEI